MIKNIRIQNFRSLVDVTVDLDPLTVLIGRSGTGKSNFVHAVRFLQDCLAERRVEFKPREGVERHRHFDHATEAFGFDVVFTVPSYGEEFRYQLRRLHSGEIDESLSLGVRVLFHHAHRQWIVPPGDPTTTGPGGVRLGSIPSLQESTFAYRALRYGIATYDFPTDVLSRNGKENDAPELGLREQAENYLLIAERIFSDPNRGNNWKKLSGISKSVIRSISALTLQLPDVQHMLVSHDWNGQKRSFDVRQESEGFRRFLAHVLALYQNPPKQTLIFEHPESGLHPGALEALAEEFKDCPEEGRGQVILTTHSPQLLNYFPVASIRVVDIEAQQTRIDRLAPEQVEAVREHLLFPGELLTVDPARLPGQLDEVPG